MAVHLPGCTDSEIGLYAKQSGGIVLLGDALLNSAAKGLGVLPQQYCDDRRQLRQSLHRLLDFNFKTVTFAHGDPLVGDAKKHLARFLRVPNKTGK